MGSSGQNPGRPFLDYLSLICGKRNFKFCALFRTTKSHYINAKVESWVDMGLEKGKGEEGMIQISKIRIC